MRPVEVVVRVAAAPRAAKPPDVVVALSLNPAALDTGIDVMVELRVPRRKA